MDVARFRRIPPWEWLVRRWEPGWSRTLHCPARVWMREEEILFENNRGEGDEQRLRSFHQKT